MLQLNRFTGACLALLFILSAKAQTEWQNSLKPEGKPAIRLTVAKDGRAAATIYIPTHATAPETKAAQELQHWLKEITGATVEIKSGKASRNSINLVTDPKLGDEGYAIAASGSRLVLSGGRTRGVVNAVYALLEEDLGCRFYTSESIRLPKTNTLVLAPVARSYIPRLKIRDPFYACAFDPVWSLRNRTDAPSAAVPDEFGGRVDYAGMFVHTAAQIVPPDRYFKDHPDYFAQRADGTRSTAQLCATHPEVAQLAIAYVRQVLKDNPHTEILSVSKNDNTEICHCDRCRKLRDAEGSDMANQLCLVNQVAAAIEKDHPRVAIDTLAYLETIQVPKTVRPRANVVIRLCNDSVGAWSRPFTPAERCDVAKLAGAWSAAHHRIYIWDYNVNFSHYLAPMPNLDVMAANIRFWVKNNAEGVMLQGGYQGPAERDEMKSWVTAKLLWNPSWDENALAQDFIRGHYGKAAPAMEQYEALLAKMRKDYVKVMDAPPGGIRYPMDAPFFSLDFVVKATQIFTRARQLALGDDALVRRVERAKLPLLYVKCVRGPEFLADDFPRVVGAFERIARENKIQFLQEGPADFDQKLATYRAKIGK